MLRPDFLRPLGDQERKEVILVQLHGVLVNTNYAALKNFLHAIDFFKDLRPAFPILTQMLQDMKDRPPAEQTLLLQQYCALMPPGGHMYRAFSNMEVSMENCLEFDRIYREKINLVEIGPSLMCVSLTNLAPARFLSDLYIQVDTADNEAIRFVKLYLEPAFSGPNSQKLHLVQGEIPEILETYPNITTCIVNSAEDFEVLEKIGKSELLRNRSWVFPMNFVDCGKELVAPANHAKYEQWAKEKFCEVGQYFPFPAEAFLS